MTFIMQMLWFYLNLINYLGYIEYCYLNMINCKLQQLTLHLWFVVSDTTSFGGQSCRTFDAVESMGGVVRVVEPTEPPVTALL